MKPQNKNSSKGLSKGDRLKWTPIRKVKPVVLSPDLTEGKKLDSGLKDFQADNSGNLNLFVP